MRILIAVLMFILMPISQALAGTPSPWPPKIGQAYPDLELIDQSGKTFKISELKGKVIFVEPIGMNCPACQAFSGGNEIGAFENNMVQKGLPSIESMFPTYAKGIKLSHKDIIFVQLLLYDMKLGAPTAKDATKWAKHFKMKLSDNQIVAVPVNDLRSSASYNLIPGFQLIDKDFILRSDSTGHRPKDDLYRKLLPMVPKLIK